MGRNLLRSAEGCRWRPEVCKGRGLHYATAQAWHCWGLLRPIIIIHLPPCALRNHGLAQRRPWSNGAFPDTIFFCVFMAVGQIVVGVA